ncbi:MAG TPA: alpha/beta hydrolase-fold protein [Acidobacteriota bacterium]
MKRKLMSLLLILAGLASWHHFVPAQSTPAADVRTAPVTSQSIAPENAGAVEFKSLESNILGQPLNFSIYLPPSYAKGEQKYRVIYFLHGLFENEKRWSDRGGKELLDRLIADKKVGELVVAIPDGGRSFYTNYYDGSRKYEDAVLQEFIPYVESHYRILRGTKSRALSGSSMGGYGALKIGMKHPDLFDSVSAHSAVLVPKFPEVIEPGTRQARYLQILEGPFGKPFNRDYWESENPLRLAEDPQKFRNLKLYFDCGDKDRYGFDEGARELHRVLEEKGFKHEFAILPGDHGWEYLKQYMDRSLVFHWKHFED